VREITNLIHANKVGATKNVPNMKNLNDFLKSKGSLAIFCCIILLVGPYFNKVNIQSRNEIKELEILTNYRVTGHTLTVGKKT
jgi:hypothetical protein